MKSLFSFPLTELDQSAPAEYRYLDAAQLELHSLRNRLHAFENDHFVLTMSHRKKLMAARALLAELRKDIQADMARLTEIG